MFLGRFLNFSVLQNSRIATASETTRIRILHHGRILQYKQYHRLSESAGSANWFTSCTSHQANHIRFDHEQENVTSSKVSWHAQSRWKVFSDPYLSCKYYIWLASKSSNKIKCSIQRGQQRLARIDISDCADFPLELLISFPFCPEISDTQQASQQCLLNGAFLVGAILCALQNYIWLLWKCRWSNAFVWRSVDAIASRKDNGSRVAEFVPPLLAA